MASTLLEVTRAAHEEVERLEQLIVKDLHKEPTSNRERLNQNHRVRNRMEAITFTTEKLIDIYEDNDNARKDEIGALGGQTAANVFSAFYDRLKEINRLIQLQAAPVVVDAAEEELLKEEEPHVEFSGEEGYGRYLDLHELYNEYINSKFGEPIEYSDYLNVFSQPHKIISRDRNRNRDRDRVRLRVEYREYLEHMLEYLIYFFRRTEPLQDLDRIFSKVETEFEHLWEDGKVEGWEKLEVDSAAIDLDYYNTVEELMEVGTERLKEALAAIGLKTGGTIRERADRLFLTKYTPIEQLDIQHFAKSSQRTADSKDIALKEAKMKRLCELLNETILQTKEYVERKQALTFEEMEAEREEEEMQADHLESGDEEEQQIYNPLKLPMGWDGKPIKYWLYKLHGLGQEFNCEICGNQSYWGRREFERHFKESLHQNGMRRLDIPNTKNFNEITSIQDAKLLWESIQERQRMNQWQPELEEEYEDKEGNIYNKKTYADLQRQGLI